MRNHVFLGDLRADFPWVLSPRRRGKAPGRFGNPRGAVLGPGGEVYVADTGNRRVQVFAGESSDRPAAVLDLPAPPTALAVRGSLLAVLVERRELRVYQRTGRGFSLLAAGRAGEAAHAVEIGPKGRLFVAFNGGRDRHQLKRYRANGKSIEELATIAPSFMDQWPDLFPDAVPMITGPDGQVWFSARGAGKVLSLDPRTGRVRERLTKVADPVALAFDPRGRLYVGVRGARILRFSVDESGTPPRGPSARIGPLYDDRNVPVWGLLPDADGGVYVRVVEKGYRKGWPAVTLKKVCADGTTEPFVDFGNLYAVRTRFPPWEGFYSMEFDGEGNIIAAVHPMLAVLKLTREGEVVWEASLKPRGGADAVEFGQPRDIAVDSRGNVWVADGKRNEVVCLSPRGKLLARHGRYADVDERGGEGFDGPSGVAVARQAEKEYLYVGDAGNQRIVEYEVAADEADH